MTGAAKSRAEKLLKAREAATQGEWHHTPGDSYCAYPHVSNKTRMFIFEDHAGHPSCDPKFCEEGYPADEYDPAFITLAAQETAWLARNFIRAIEALDIYSDMSIDLGNGRTIDCGTVARDVRKQMESDK